MSDLVTVSDSGEDDAPSRGSNNVLDLLRAKLEEHIEIPLVEIDVPKRPGISVVYRPEVSSAQLRSWQKKASNRRSGELNNLKFSSTVLMAMVEGIKVNGEYAELENGDPVLFNSAEFAKMMNVDMSEINPDGIKDFFIVEAHIENTALRLLDEAGYGDSLEVEDPTKES